MVAGSVVWLIVESEEFARQGCGSDQRIRARARPTATGKTNQKREASRIIVSIAARLRAPVPRKRRAYQPQGRAAKFAPRANIQPSFTICSSGFRNRHEP